MTAGELSELLAQNAQRLVERLLPNGKLRSGEWQVGNVDGEAGKSLSVHLHGAKAGVWSDFATGEGGDLLDLIRAVRHCGLREACSEARAFLGIAEPDVIAVGKAQPRRPKRPKCHTPQGPVREYLAGRGISAETLQVYRVGEAGTDMIFPFLTPDGELAMAKRREARDGAAPKPTEAGCEKILFGWQAVSDSARGIVLTEGEIDAMSVFQATGIPALSLPFGGGGGNKQDWCENELDRLAIYDEIVLMLDADDTGQQAVAEIAKRLGIARLRVAKIPAPHKDANDMLRAGLGQSEFARVISQARPMDPADIKSPDDYRELVKQAGTSMTAPGFDLPWQKTHDRFRCRFGELILVAGYNGHGKTEIIGNILLSAMAQGVKTLSVSLEFLPYKWLRRVVRQATAIAEPSDIAVDSVIDWMQGKLWLLDVHGTAKRKVIVDRFRYVVRRFGVKLLVLDNLSKCGLDDDDYTGQKAFVDELSDVARELDVTLIVAMHARKGEDESRPPGKMDLRGSGQISDVADSVLVCWRNKPKEKKLAMGEECTDPDAKLICHKQRNGEEEPSFAFWFHQESHQFIESPQRWPRRYGMPDRKEAEIA